MTKKTNLGLSRNAKVQSVFDWRGKPCETATHLKLLGTNKRRPLEAPKRTILDHFEPVKQRPGVGAMRTA